MDSWIPCDSGIFKHLQLYKSYRFPLFSFILGEQTSQQLVIRLFLAAISLRAAAAERDADLTRIVFSLNSHHLF